MHEESIPFPEDETAGPQRDAPDGEPADRPCPDQESVLPQSPRHDLVRPCDIRGILHSHSRYGDGAHPLASMVATAREIGLDYLGISDHYQSAAHRNGLSLEELAAQRAEIDELQSRNPGFDILQGIELDALPDGRLPLDDDTLAAFDYVIVSFPENGGYDPDTLTGQVVALSQHPRVAILGRPVGDFMMRRSNGVLDMEAVLKAAAAGGTAVEINANPSCPELDWSCCRRAQELGVPIAISPNAHRAARLVDYRHGAELAQDAGLCCSSILNTLTVTDLRRYLATGVRPET